MKRRLLIILICFLSPTVMVPKQPPADRTTFLPMTGAAVQSYIPSAADRLPDLQTFIAQLQNGRADQIVGLYIPGLAALPVLYQPAGEPFYVDDHPQSVTLFSSSLTSGSVGLLAHSHLAGRLFTQVRSQQLAVLIFGDSRTETYRIDHLESYQALQPNDPYSTFASLNDGRLWDSQALFTHIYASGPNLILQTCMEMDDQSNWGRLFVIASPTSSQSWKWLSGISRLALAPL